MPPLPIKEFLLERYFARYEFQAPYLLSSSDCETYSIADLLALTGWTLADLGALRLGYTESAGAPTLRAAVAELYQDTDTVSPLSAEHVLIVTPEEGIFLTLWGLLSPGDAVIVQTPCYQSLTELATYQQAIVVPWPMQETETGWAADLDQLAGLITPRTKLIIINSPHNPTGYHFSRRQLADIIALADHHNLWLFCDEMYRGAEYRPEDRLPSASQLYDRAISLAGMSKTYGLPGLRIGWLTSPRPAVLARLMQLKDYTTICPSAPSEFLAEAALTVAPQLARRSLEIVRANLALARDFAQQHHDFIAWREPMAGPVAFVKYRPGSVKAMALELVESEGVMLAPAHTFNFGDQHFRLGLGRSAFPAGLARFEHFLQQRI